MTRRIIIIIATSLTLLLLGGPSACDKSQGAGSPSGAGAGSGEPAGAAQGAPGTAAPKASRPASRASGAGDAALPGQLERWFQAAKRPFKAVDVAVPLEKLDDVGALSAHAFDARDPAVRVFVFEFADAQLAARGVTGIVSWINRSGLVFSGEATVNKQLVIVVGVPEARELDEDTKTAINDFMDAFMMGR